MLSNHLTLKTSPHHFQALYLCVLAWEDFRRGRYGISRIRSQYAAAEDVVPSGRRGGELVPNHPKPGRFKPCPAQWIKLWQWHRFLWLLGSYIHQQRCDSSVVVMRSCVCYRLPSRVMMVYVAFRSILYVIAWFTHFEACLRWFSAGVVGIWWHLQWICSARKLAEGASEWWTWGAQSRGARWMPECHWSSWAQ